MRICKIAPLRWRIVNQLMLQNGGLTQLDERELLQGDVAVRIVNSSINYKDALALTGKAPIIRRFPYSSRRRSCRHCRAKQGTTTINLANKVIVNGRRICEVHWGGLAELARLRPESFCTWRSRRIGAQVLF
jgi:acrylyl-CoA reductase (NADPH)